MRLSFLGILLALSAFAQSESWNTFTFTLPPGNWQRNTQPNRLEMNLVNGSRFCQISLFHLGGGKGDPRADFQADWRSMIQNAYGAPAIEPEVAPSVSGWQTRRGSATVNGASAGRFNLTLYSFTKGNQVASMVLSANHDGCDRLFGPLVAGLRIGENPAVSPPPAGNVPPPASSNPLPGGEGNVTRANIAGWQGEIFKDYVRFDKDGIAVLIFWNVAMDNELRSGHTGMNIWRRLVPRHFRVLSEAPVEEEQFSYFQRNAVLGQVADSSGRRYAAYMTNGMRNGIATPFLVLAADEGKIRRTFKDAEAIWDMVAYNHFPVSPAELVGRWTSSFSSAAESYYVGSGNYAGLTVAAASVDYQFLPNGTYTEDSQAVGGMVGNLRVSKQRRTGTWQVNVNTLILRESTGKVDEYQCGLVAIGGGKALRIQHKQYTGNKWDLVRAK